MGKKMQKVSYKTEKSGLALNSDSLAQTIYKSIVFIAFFLILFFPRQLSAVKGILLLIAILLRLDKIVTYRFNSSLTKLFILYLAYCVIGVLASLFYNGNFEFDAIKVRLFWFLLFLVFSLTINRKDVKIVLLSCFAAFWAIIFYNFMLVGVAYHIIPNNALVNLDYTAAVGIHDGYVHITSTNTSMLMLLYPLFFISYFLLSKKQFSQLGINKILVLCSLILGTVCMILTGRRILWISVISAFFVAVVSSKNKNIKILFIILVLFILLFLYLQGTLSGLMNRFLSAFSKEDIRFEQISILTTYILNKPLFGYGFNSYFYLPSRGLVNVVETTYMQILFNTGVVGFLCYIIAYLGIIKYIVGLKNRTEYTRCFKIVAITILLFMFFANATNPYIGSSFDFYIFIFVPLIILKIEETKV